MFSIECFYLGMFITLSIYHLFVYLGRRKDLSNLSYFLYGISLSLMLLFNRIYIFSAQNIYQISAILSALFVAFSSTFFLFTIFDFKKVRKIIITGFTIYFFTSIIAIIYFFFKFIKFYRIITNVCAILYLLLFITFATIEIIKKKQYRHKKEKIVIIGFSPVLLSFIIMAIPPITGRLSPFIITYSMFLIMLLIFAYALTDSFNQEHRDLIGLTNTLEQKVIDRTKKLEESHKQKIDFINNVLHEIRTPVTILTNSLKNYMKKQERSSDIEIVQQNADKLEKDVLNLLDIQKFEKGKIIYNHDQIINLGDMLINKAIIFMPIAKKKNIKIFRNIPPKDIYIKIDPYAMDRIISNLLDNAIRYTKEYGTIDILLEKAEDKAILIINDTGIGISEEQQKHIFEPYYQISRKKSNVQGIGMGLNIVKSILNEINAEIKVKSKLGKGTSFIIRLNMHKLLETDRVIEDIKYSDAIDSVVDVELKEEEYKPGRNNVLIVEDDLNMLLHLQNSMYDTYNFYYARNGQEALEKLKKISKPDVIILDIMMDEMDGYTFYDMISLNKKFKYIPVLFLTAISRQEEKIKGLSKGAIDFITKPFSMKELLAKISSIIKIEEGKKESDIIELADDIRNYLINKTNKKLLDEEKDKAEEENRNILDKLYFEYGISKKEVEILNLLSKGLMRKEIAYELNISIGTVKTYMSRIFTKCKVESKKELLKIFNIKSK